MRDRRRAVLAALVLVALLAVVVPTASPSLGFPALPPQPGAAASPSAGVQAAGVPLHPHPLVTCPTGTPPLPQYSPVGIFYPPTPSFNYQGPCNFVSQDAIHATFSSPLAYSGERFTLPLWLPPDGAIQTQSGAYHEVFVGMVVGGNSSSGWGQSYAEVTFSPVGGAWNASVVVWSLLNDSVYGGSPSESSSACPANSMWFSWNNSYFCLVQMISSPSVLSVISGGSFLNVTLAGDVSGTTGLEAWVNDSSNPSRSWNYTFSSANTGTDTFEPFYNASCPDACLLMWAFPFGDGFGAFPFNYSEPHYRGMPPVTLGVPRFWNGTAYGGEYTYFAPESTSGACNQAAPPFTVATCFDYSNGGGTGYYPYFSFNGSQMNFGSDWPWTSIRLGGVSQFLGSGAMNDMTPLWLYTRSNSSLAGFSPPGSTIYLNATAESLGTVTGVSYQFQINGGAWTGQNLSRVSGGGTNASYSGALPSTLGNGLINYTFTVADHAGSSLIDPPFGVYHIRRGPLPTFKVNLSTNGGSCARVKISGVDYVSGSQFVTHPGTFPVDAVGCYPYNFTQWVVTGGVGVSPSLYLRAGTLIVSGNGTLLAAWSYVRPYDTIAIATDPTGCGSISLDGTTYSDGGSAQLLDGLSHTLGESGCANEVFAGYTFTGNFTILGTSFTPNGNGTLTANFVSSTAGVSIQFFTEPSSCGGVVYRGAGYTNGESLTVLPGTYSIAPGPCAHFGFLEWQYSGGVTATGGNVTVTGAGSLTEVNYHLTEITFEVSPTSCGLLQFDGKNYTNGAVLSVANNSTHTVYPLNASGCYLIALSATGGILLEGNVAIVNGSGAIEASFGLGTPADTIAFLTSPPNCGSISFNNQPYYNANFTNVAPGLVVTISATPCAGYGFVRWLTFGPITIIGSTAWLNSSGAIEAVFEPLVQVFFNTEPASCGSIIFGGQSYPTNSTGQVAMLATYSLVADPCAGYTLDHWINSSSIFLTPGAAYVTGSGVLTAVFVPIVYSVLLLVDPATCGSVLVNGARTVNGTTLRLAAGSYPLTPEPCLGNHLDHWATTGNLSVSAASLLTVGGPGNVTAFMRPVPPTVVLSVPASTLVGQQVQLFATVAVPVPPFNYSYTWSFGDGSAPVTTPVNFTGHTFHSTGSFTVKVTVRDPYDRYANSTVVIGVLPLSAAQAFSLSSLQITAFGVIGAAIVLVALVAYFRGRAERAREAESAGGAEASPPLETERNHDK